MCRIPHRIMISNVREDKGFGARPKDCVLKNACKKAGAVAGRLKKGIVIGADTIVFLDGRIIGKLKKKEAVKRTLRRLSEKVSYVYTGLAIIDVGSGRCLKDYVKTKIKMKRIGEQDLNLWLKFIGPFDRAGGFSIEGPGSILFPRIEGCYFNILGLPMSKLCDMFERLGFNLLYFMKGGDNYGKS